MTNDESEVALEALVRSLEVDPGTQEYRYFLRERDLERQLEHLILSLGEDQDHQTPPLEIHLAPMRPPKLIARNFSQPLERIRWKPALTIPKVHWYESVYQLETWIRDHGQSTVDRAADVRRVIVGADLTVNTGTAQVWFLWTLAEAHRHALPGFFEKIIIFGISGFHSSVPASVASQLSIPVEQRFARPLTQRDRPLAGDPSGVLERLVRRSLALDVACPQQQRIFERARRTATFLCLETGCPTIGLPLFWSEVDWTPLWRSLDYYVAHRRPYPRAPFYSAYQKTLDELLERTEKRRPVLLHGRQGTGKTFVAARAVTLWRVQNRYAFWHDCLDFDTIENVLGHLDRYLEELGIAAHPAANHDPAATAQTPVRPMSLKEMWIRGEAKAAGIVDELLRRLARLDRATLLVFDRVHNVRRSLREGGAFWEFLKALSRKTRHLAGTCEPHPESEVVTGSPLDTLAQLREPNDTSGGGSTLSGPGSMHGVPAVVFILQTHVQPHVDPDAHVASLSPDPAVVEASKELELAKHDCFTCPIDTSDVFDDPTLLSRRLLRPGEEKDDHLRCGSSTADASPGQPGSGHRGSPGPWRSSSPGGQGSPHRPDPVVRGGHGQAFGVLGAVPAGRRVRRPPG
ncbi:MAG: ATP-binding protein [Polyangiaceae bacterium]|nr:ATP-binding protein [Polyangiaceae bacterium]